MRNSLKQSFFLESFEDAESLKITKNDSRGGIFAAISCLRVSGSMRLRHLLFFFAQDWVGLENIYRTSRRMDAEQMVTSRNLEL